MNGIEQLKLASAKSQEIISRFSGLADQAPDVIQARTEELSALKKDELIALVISLEKVKTEKAFKVEDIVKEILETPECACFNYEQIAALVHQVLPEAKTSSKSVASYASKKKDEWNIVARERLNFSHADLLNMASNA